MLQELLKRLDYIEGGHGPITAGAIPLSAARAPLGPLPQVSDRCTLYGLWLSVVTGVRIQLEPISDHEVKLHVIDLASTLHIGEVKAISTFPASGVVEPSYHQSLPQRSA